MLQTYFLSFSLKHFFYFLSLPSIHFGRLQQSQKCHFLCDSDQQVLLSLLEKFGGRINLEERMADRAQLLSMQTCQAEGFYPIPQEWKSFATGSLLRSTLTRALKWNIRESYRNHNFLLCVSNVTCWQLSLLWIHGCIFVQPSLVSCVVQMYFHCLAVWGVLIPRHWGWCWSSRDFAYGKDGRQVFKHQETLKQAAGDSVVKACAWK